MFEEKEPGKPKNWSYTVTIIALIIFLNITIIIVCRIWLDSQDENHNYWLQGKSRENLTFFLSVFATSFFFYCCCCFCCGGSLCRWIANWYHKYFDLSKLLSTTVKTDEKSPISHNKQKDLFFISNVSNNNDDTVVDVANNKKPYAYANDAFVNSSKHRSLRKNSKSILTLYKEELTDYSKFKCQSKRRNSF